MAFDVSGIPFNGWPGTQAFYQTLISESGIYPEGMPFDMSMRQYLANSLYYPLSNIPSLDLPSIKGLSILLIIYILIVGPLNYFLLRWQRKLHLAWVTIPAITLLFAGAAFGIGYLMRGNDLVLNKIALIQTHPEGDASVTSYMGLFSPRMQSYEVTVQGESLISPMSGYDVNPWENTGVNTGSQMTFVQSQPSRVIGLTVNQWAMQSFMSEGTWQDFGSFSGDLHIKDEALTGTIRNDSKYTLTDVVLIMQARFTRLGDFVPGEVKEVDMGLGNLQADQFSTPLSYRLYQEPNINEPMSRDNENKMNIISNIFENMPMSKMMSSVQFGSRGISSTNDVTIFGWLDQAPPSVDVPDNRLSQNTTALVYATLNYQFADEGYIVVPPGIIPGKLSKYPTNGGACNNTASIYMTSGEAEFEFQVPDNIAKYNVQTLKLAIWRDSGNNTSLPEVSVYDWGNESWINIQDPIQGNNIIHGAAPYMNSDGTVRVRMSTDTDTFGCVYLNLGLEAESIAGQGE